MLGVACRSNPSQLLSALFKAYYGDKSSAKNRFGLFRSHRFDDSNATVQAAAETMLGALGPGEIEVIRDLFWVKNFGSLSHPTPQSVSEGVRKDVARAFVSQTNQFAMGTA